jgi:2-polyprenyl-3-methyl-5-hydroxy-6-metoxy-1,4-benzoquinol methylase
MHYNNSIQALLGLTDIYLIDQIMKGRYQTGDHILDAGCGNGRNLHWFIQNGFNIQAIDINREVIDELKLMYPGYAANFTTASVENTDFTEHRFDHIICSAVLHFARDMAHFHLMFAGLVHLLKPGGTLFIRMASDIGIEQKVVMTGDGVYTIPDGSTRFLLTRTLLADCLVRYRLQFAEPLKTTNVEDTRCMTTLVLQLI